MEDHLVSDESLPFDEARRLPRESWFVPESIKEEQALSRVRTELAADPDFVVITDTDADGLGCAALTSLVGQTALIESGPHGAALTATEALNEVAEMDTTATVFVCDICPDDPVSEVQEAIEAAKETHPVVNWFDHHQYSDEMQSMLIETCNNAAFGAPEDDEEYGECATSLVAWSIKYTYDLTDETEALVDDIAAVTRDHDLWIKDDERSDTLAEYAYLADSWEYVETIAEHGPDFPERVHDELEAFQEKKQQYLDAAVENAEWFSVGEVTVAAVYGRVPSSDAGEMFRQHGADLTVMVKPHGGVSLRGSDTFEECHTVCDALGGGGHPKAAGCKPIEFTSMFDLSTHWETNGEEVLRIVLNELQTIIGSRPEATPAP